MDKNSRNRSILFGMGLFMLLTLLILSVVRKIDPEVFKVLKNVSSFWILTLFFLNGFYQLMEAMVCKTMLKNSMQDFSIGNALAVTYIGVFANIATPFGGRVPMQSLYLYHKGLMAGSGVGMMWAEYLFHKTALTLCAAFFLLADRPWIQRNLPDIWPYLLFAFGICMIIVLFMLLICTWNRIKETVLSLLERIPDRGKWADRKMRLRDNIEILYREIHLLMESKKRMVTIFLIEVGKLLSLYWTPFFCGRILGVYEPECFHILALASLMFMLSNALPNISGMGSVEFSFFLIFSGIYQEFTFSILFLYRIATYYMPFFLSCICFPYVCRKYLRHKVS